MKSLFFLFSLCVLYSCSKEPVSTDSDGVVIRRPHLWAKSTTDDGSRINTYFVQEITTYDNKLVIGARKNAKRILRALDIDNGDTKWDWYDIIEERDYLGIEQPVIIDNKLIWQANYWNYCIDFNNGQTVWKNAFQENFEDLPTGLGDKFVGMHNYDRTTNALPDGGEASVFDKSNGQPYFFVRPRYDTTGMQPFEISQRRGIVRFNRLFVQGVDTLLLLTFFDPPLYNYNNRQCLALYNLTKKQWIYDRADMLGTSRNNTGHAPCIYQGKIYSAFVGTMVCNDLMTGKKLWQSDYYSQDGFATTGLIVIDGKIYGNSDSGYMYCWDLETGQQQWRIRTSGTASRLSHLNGVLYFTGAGDGNLPAIEAATGKYLWKIESPDTKKNEWAIFGGLCAVVPGKNGAKGKVIVLNGLNAYCYEAER